jgi:Rps23 Pro-64 3,4-dihydroxylase Tpa1-like proline 4-hydroxylase
MFPSLNNIDFKSVPFKFFSSTQNTNEATISVWLDWFENKAPWRLIETDFYEQHEFSLLNIELPECLSGLVSKNTLGDLKSQVEELFNVKISNKIEVVAHKLVKGQTIRIHNDFLNIPDRETHRVLLQLNRNFDENSGGFLMIFKGREPEDIVEIIEPTSGSVQGFEISSESNHAVSTIHNGERYTVVYSFRSEVG